MIDWAGDFVIRNSQFAIQGLTIQGINDSRISDSGISDSGISDSGSVIKD